MMSLSSALVNGPIYLPFSSSLCMMSEIGPDYSTVEGLLDGV